MAPLALAGWGLALATCPSVTAPGALNAGAILVLASLLLAFAAQTAGLGPEHPARHGYFEQRFFTVHGGAVGEALDLAATMLFQRLGAQILAVLMFASGVLLLTGTTVAGLMSRAGRFARSAGTGTRELAKTVRTGRQGIESFDSARTRSRSRAPAQRSRSSTKRWKANRMRGRDRGPGSSRSTA